MADRGDTHYHVRKLNLWFAASSLVLLGSTLWMVLHDWQRPWKSHQREFRRIEAQRAQQQLDTPEAQASLADEARLEQELAQSEAALAGHKDKLDQAETELRNLKGAQFIATEAEKKAKQVYNWERWGAEERELAGQAGAVAGLEKFEDELAVRAGTKQQADADVLAQEKRNGALRADVARVESELKASTKGIDLVRKKLQSIAPRDFPTQLANVIRDFPGIDFIGPSLKVARSCPRT